MTDSYPVPALIWQADIEALVAIIEARHTTLSANFNQYIASNAEMALCVRVQQHVDACYVRDGYGLLTRRNHRS